ncbi:MAG: acetate--CoA ligase family protein [Patescibacteria group bacterium]|nr:acetate--CoA ligase family protein [Patescibacteria group bacterium]
MKSNIFSPKSIAIIGASPHKKKLGFQVLKNVIDGGYKGKIYPINIDPSIRHIQSHKSYSSVLKVPGKIDMAVFVIPAKFVPQALQECGKKKIKLAVIISAGFKEVGGEGVELEKQILKIAKKSGIRILGPNCLGFINTKIKLNASFAPSMPSDGNVAVVSQSGAICTAILDWASKNHIGFSKFFSLGNKSDITELDLLPYLASDKQTSVITSYLENVAGNNGGDDFRGVAEKTTLKKPVVILKAGISEKGAAAISSHTGSLAGSNQAISSLFKQSGVIRANSLEDLFDYAEAFSLLKAPTGNRVAIITNAGGPGVMTTDAIEGTKLELATLTNETQEKLKKVLPPAANIHNPIDLVGDADDLRYKNALNIIETDKNVDSILVLLTPQTSTKIEATAELVLKKIKKSSKTIIPIFMGGKRANHGIDIFEKNHSAVFEYPERAVKALEKISFCQSCEMGIRKIYPPKILKIKKSRKNKVNKIIVGARRAVPENQPTLIAGSTADEILKQYDIPILKSSLAKARSEAIKKSKKIGFPVVFKIDSPDIIHKSDVGGVIVGIKNEKEAGVAFSKIMSNIKRNAPRAKINGIMIYEMVSLGIEFFIGAKRDPTYGPLVGFGLGGVFVEILKDVSFRLAPLSYFDIDKMIGELKSAKIISGARGKGSLDKKGIVDALIKVSNLMINHPQISELDINPLAVFENRVVAVDNRLIIL